ncbi:MAG: caspase family protein [Bacteroidota bacterium]|nr:caspase family protein [Bacteroidota bacterium]
MNGRVKIVTHAFLFMFLVWAGKTGAQKVRLAVLEFRGAAPPTSDLAYFGPAAQSIFTTAFSRLPMLDLVERERLDDLSRELRLQQSEMADPSTRSRLGKLLGVQVLLFGSYFQLGDVLRVDARMVEVETGRVLRAEEVTDRADRVFSVIRELTQKFAAALEDGKLIEIPKGGREDIRRGIPNNPRAFAAYSEALRIIDTARSLERAEDWERARLAYLEAQKFLRMVLKDERDFEAGKSALRRAERKVREIEYFLETGERMPVRIWSLVIGVDTYRDISVPTLRFAVSDARLVDSLLRNPQCGALPAQRIRLLTDTAATRAAILSALDYLLKASQEDDVLFVYFAGHGMLDAGSFYFLSSDAEPSRLSATAVPASQINDMIRKQGRMKKVLWVIDACHAGATADDGARAVSDANELLREIAKAENGYAILSASHASQEALEFEDRGHGVFTFFLAEGLKGFAETAPSDGFVRLGELAEYVSAHVNAVTEGRQTPRCFGCESVDFPLARVH